jgi:hypothetical protein
VNVELSLDPTHSTKHEKSEEFRAKQWTPFSLLGSAFGVKGTFVERVFEAQDNATYCRSEHIDSWAVPVAPRVSVTVVHGVSAPKIVREQAKKVVLPATVQLRNVQKLNVEEREKALLSKMKLPAYVPSECGGILRSMRDFCASQAEYDDDVLSMLRAATAREGSVELHAYEFCSSADIQYRAAELSTTNSMIQVRIQADCDDLGWSEPVAHFEWDVPSFVTDAFVQACKESCKEVMEPFVSKATLEKLDTMWPKDSKDPRELTFGEVLIRHERRNLVDIPTFGPQG